MEDEQVFSRITRALAAAPLAYEEERAFARSQAKQGLPWQEAGVLVLLTLCEDGPAFVLNKRSQNVSQPGDLCWPGGHPQPAADRIMARLVIPHLLPMRKDPGFKAAKKRRTKTFDVLSFFLANALRECWEEMGVRPRRVHFLGPLPCYRLMARRKIVYPMAGFASGRVDLKTGREIEANVLLPLESLFDEKQYGIYTLELTGKFREFAGTDAWEVPCFKVQRKNGPDEILWGATFNILMSLLKTVYGFSPPAAGPVRARAPLYPAQAK